MEIKGTVKKSETELVNESKPRGIGGKLRHISFGADYEEKTLESEEMTDLGFEEEGPGLD